MPFNSNIIVTEEFEKTLKKLSIQEEDLHKPINNFVETEERCKFGITTNSFCIITRQNGFILWKIRLPNKNAKSGKRSGFRLLLVYFDNDKTWRLHNIFEKNDKIEKEIQKRIQELISHYQKIPHLDNKNLF